MAIHNQNIREERIYFPYLNTTYVRMYEYDRNKEVAATAAQLTAHLRTIAAKETHGASE